MRKFFSFSRNTVIRLMTVCLLSLFSHSAFAVWAELTYTHDESVMQQWNVMMTDAGHLTPELYYKAFHSSYFRKAYMLSKSKPLILLTAKMHNEIEYSDSLKSSLQRQAKIAAIDIVERRPGLSDVAWTFGVGDNLDAAMHQFQANIRRIASYGTGEEFTMWQDQYNLLQGSINCIRAAYLPNGERQREYTRIFGKAQDLNRQISERLDFLYAYREMRRSDGQNRGLPHVNGAAIAARAILRWQDKWNNRPAV